MRSGYRIQELHGDTISIMKPRSLETDWFDRLVAVLFATVAVLGLVTVVTTVALFLPGGNGSSIPMP